jgi:hypothetical protein
MTNVENASKGSISGPDFKQEYPMTNLDFNPDKSENKSEDRKVEKPLEKGYRDNGAWWGWLPLSDECPNTSTLPDDGSPCWKEGDIPQEIQEEYFNGDPCVQGWKLHLAVDRAGRRFTDKTLPIEVAGLRVAYVNPFDQFPPTRSPWLHKQRDWTPTLATLFVGLTAYVVMCAIGWVIDGFISS